LPGRLTEPSSCRAPAVSQLDGSESHSNSCLGRIDHRYFEKTLELDSVSRHSRASQNKHICAVFVTKLAACFCYAFQCALFIDEITHTQVHRPVSSYAAVQTQGPKISIMPAHCGWQDRNNSYIIAQVQGCRHTSFRDTENGPTCRFSCQLYARIGETSDHKRCRAPFVGDNPAERPDHLLNVALCFDSRRAFFQRSALDCWATGQAKRLERIVDSPRHRTTAVGIDDNNALAIQQRLPIYSCGGTAPMRSTMIL
jgi:hypothetical protein